MWLYCMAEVHSRAKLLTSSCLRYKRRERSWGFRLPSEDQQAVLLGGRRRSCGRCGHLLPPPSNTCGWGTKTLAYETLGTFQIRTTASAKALDERTAEPYCRPAWGSGPTEPLSIKTQHDSHAKNTLSTLCSLKKRNSCSHTLNFTSIPIHKFSNI